MKICEASADACEASFYALRAFLMVFRSPPNSNGLAVSMSPARTNPPLTGTLAFSTFWWAGSLVVRESRHRRDRIFDKNSRKRRRNFGSQFFFKGGRAHPVFSGEFSFFGRGKTNFFREGGGYNFKTD